MRAALLFGLATIVAPSLIAQTGDVRGLIRSTGEGIPLPGAEISLAATASGSDGSAYTESIRSGPDGRFFFSGLAPGGYVLGIRKSGYEAGVRVSRSLEIEADGDRVDLEIELRRSAAIAGRVVDPDGDPVPNASGFAGEWDTARGRRTLRQIKSGRTDDRGEFRLHGLSAGPYVVGAHPLQLPAPKGVLAFDLAPQYYPNAAAASGAVPLRLAWGGGRLGLEFQLEWSPETALEGAVQNEGGSACTDCVVSGVSDDSPTPLIVTVNQQGLFAIRGAAPGSYQLLAQRGRDRMFDHAAAVLVEGSTVRTALRLSPGQTVSGRIVFDEEPEEPLSTQPIVELRPFFQTFGTRALRARVDAAGSFAIEGVAPGRYTVSLRSQPPETYLDQVLIGGAPVARRNVVLGSGIPATDIELRLNTDGGIVEGAIGAEAPAGIAVLLPASYENGNFEQLASYRQSDGRIRFTGVPPGRYHLFAVPRSNHFDLGSDEDRTYLRKEGRAVRVAERQTLQLDVPFVENR
jgi:hypothetical protein